MSARKQDATASARPYGAEQQEEVVAFLSRPQAYDPVPDSVQRIDTHASLVFLAGPLAYKVKRAVRYPFLDFSTLEKRYRACLNELTLNRRTAPQLYEAVVPVTRQPDGGLAIGGAGVPVEWAVRMRRFDQSVLYDCMAEEGRLDIALMAPLADAVRALHRRADRHLTEDIMVSALARLIAENDEEMRRHGELYEPARAAALTRACRQRLDRLAPLLRSRARHGHVRHCHGDLHLRNIVGIDGRPVLFDAVEFDDAIAIVDTLDDLAFLLMDLWFRGLPAHANAVLNRYLSGPRTDDLPGLAALPLFLSTRAMIRSKAEALRADGTEDRGARNDALDRARRYFALAEEFLRPAAPMLVAVGGLSGTGKTTVARALAPLMPPPPGAVHLRSDVERKHLFAVAEEERLSEAAYRPDVTAMVYAVLAKKAGLVAAAGHSVIVDAVHGTAREREAIEAVAAREGVAFAGLWLTAPADTLLTRVGARTGDASDADAAVVRAQLDYDIGPVAWPTIRTGRPVEAVTADCARFIGLPPSGSTD